MKPKLITPPATEPLSLVDAKLHLRIDAADTDSDAIIADLIRVGRAAVEDYTGLALITQTWRLYLDAFPCGEDLRIRLPQPPLKTFSSVKYTDDTGALITLDPSKYQVDDADWPCRVAPAFGESWPATRAQLNAVQLEYIAGVDSAANIKPQAVQAIKLFLANWFENREAVVTGTITAELPLAVQMLLDQIRVFPC
ncbi:MAG: head-tail connector protein [Phycisphaerales bacterium]